MLLSKHRTYRREDHTSGEGFVHFPHPPTHDAQKSQGLGCVARSGRIEGISTPSPLLGVGL